MKLKLYTDGGARGNPGPAAIGIVIRDDNSKIIKELGLYIGSATNNDAEYKALIKGLEECINLGATNVECVLDSELVVKQLNGEYKVKNTRLKEYWREIKRLESKLSEIEYRHVKRTENKNADALVNQVLDYLENG
ncbi:ribonuclease HI family protein [Patescibacteria group bacterium]|nr:ribonuclease HI family protein [Patescibacteria group bacterium]